MGDFEIRVLLSKVALPALVVALFAPLVVYLIAKWRANREQAADPQLGFKLVLYYFATVAFQLGLLGFTMLVYTMIKPGGDEFDLKSSSYRFAFGLIVPAALVLGAHVALILRTNDAQHLGVRKLFLALNLLFTGIIGFVALLLGFQALFAKGSTGGMGHLGAAATLFYGGAWGVLGWRYHQLAIGGGSFGTGGGSQPMPDIVLPPAPSQASGGGLPPLGGGAFPPIDPKQ